MIKALLLCEESNFAIWICEYIFTGLNLINKFERTSLQLLYNQQINLDTFLL